MEKFMIFLIIIIIIGTFSNLYLFLKLGKERHGTIQDGMAKISGDINNLANIVNGCERVAVSRDNSFRSFISKNQQKLETFISQASNKNDERINHLEGRFINELQSSTNIIQNSIQHSYSGLSKSFKIKLNDISQELADIHQSIREFKEEILKTQAQSFYGVEAKISSIRNDEHRYIEQELQSIHREYSTLNKSTQDVVKVMRSHLESLKPLEELFIRLNTLYNKLVSLDKDILNQEKSLNDMVDKHVKIVEYTQEVQKTSKHIFDMMKLILMESVVKQTTPKK